MISYQNILRQRTLKLAFLYPGPEDPLLNRVVARVSKNPVCHVELVFEDDMSFSIFQGSNLFFRHRTFSNPEYKVVALNVSSEEYLKSYFFCQEAVKHDFVFTDVGMLGSYFQPRHCPFLCSSPSGYSGSTFCSKIVTEALQFGEIPEVAHLIPSTTTPSLLLDTVGESPRCVLDTVQFRKQQLFEAGIVRVNRMAI